MGVSVLFQKKKNSNIILFLVLVVLAIFLFLRLHYKEVQVIQYRGKQVRIVLDRLASRCLFCHYLNFNGEMGFHPHYKVFLEDNCILKLKIGYRSDDGMSIMHESYIQNDTLYIYLHNIGSLFQLQLPLSKGKHSITGLNVTGFDCESHNKDVNQPIKYVFKSGMFVNIYGYYTDSVAKQKLLIDASDY